MTQLATVQQMHEHAVQSLTNALFTSGEVQVSATACYTDEALPWTEPVNLHRRRRLEANEGWHREETADTIGGS
jgi:hypothetical protein